MEKTILNVSRCRNNKMDCLQFDWIGYKPENILIFAFCKATESKTSNWLPVIFSQKMAPNSRYTSGPMGYTETRDVQDNFVAIRAQPVSTFASSSAGITLAASVVL